MNTETLKFRKIRSFVRRDSRLTDLQKQLIAGVLPRLTIPIDQGFINLDEIFGRPSAKVLEIGFGSGESLANLARAYPEKDFIGIETYQPGIGALLAEIVKHDIKNIRIIYADAVEVLTACIPENALDGCQVFFPDPWRKRKHHKRRLVSDEFVALITAKLKPAGVWHLATDWAHYAEQMMQVISRSAKLINLAGAGNFANRSMQRPVETKFEKRGTLSGRPIWELQFRRCD